MVFWINWTGIKSKIKQTDTPNWYIRPSETTIDPKLLKPTMRTIETEEMQTQTTPTQQNIKVETNIWQEQQEMGKYFPDITLEQENTIRQRLKEKYPNETWEQRFNRAKAIVDYHKTQTWVQEVKQPGIQGSCSKGAGWFCGLSGIYWKGQESRTDDSRGRNRPYSRTARRVVTTLS